MIKSTFQIYAATDVLCLFYANGFIFGMVSVMIPSLRHPDSGIQLTADEESWIGKLNSSKLCILAYIIISS